MKIELDIPDERLKDSTLLVLLDQELIAVKYPKEDFKIKSVRCNLCGECCLDMVEADTPYGVDEEGRCNALEKADDKWLCTAGANKPFRCLQDPIDVEGCAIRYK